MPTLKNLIQHECNENWSKTVNLSTKILTTLSQRKISCHYAR